MNHNPEVHQRRSIRLRGYDYSQPGSYFVTVCTKGRECLFGNVIYEEVALNFAGRVVQEEWSYTEIIRPEGQVDEFVIMPNHIHGIITIREPEGLVGAHGRAPLPAGRRLSNRDFVPLPGRREIGLPSLFERLQAFFDVAAEESQHLQRYGIVEGRVGRHT